MTLQPASLVQVPTARRWSATRDDAPASDVFDEPERLERVLRWFTTGHRPVSVQQGGRRARDVEISPSPDGQRILIGRAPMLRAGAFVARCESHVGEWELDLWALRVADDRAVAVLQGTGRRTRRRSSRRVRLAATVEFSHPDHPHDRIERPVVDASEGGLAFLTDTGDRIRPGLDLAGLTIHGHDRSFTLSGRVCAITPGPDGHGHVAHVAERGTSLRDRASWSRRIVDLRHPGVAASRDDDGIWDLFDRSGYFALSDKHSERFAHLRRSYEGVMRAVETTPGLGTRLQWPREGSPAATLTLLRAYSRSMLTCHIAKVSGPGPDGTPSRDVLRSVHHAAYERLQAMDDVPWLLAYMREERSWSHLVHVDFPARHLDSGMACIVPMHVHEFSTGRLASAANASGTGIGAPTAVETDAFLTWLAATRPTAYRAALDLDHGGRRDPVGNVRWAAAGLARSRATLVHRTRGVVDAVAVLEHAEDGAHLFGLLNAVRLYRLREDGARHFPALLAAADTWFAQRHAPSFVCMHEETEGSLDDRVVRAAQSLGGASIVAVHTDLLPDLHDHVQEVTAPPPPARA